MQLSLCLPCMEGAGHELCFLSHPQHDRRLTCNIFGHLGMSGNWLGWEAWRFIKDESTGTYLITSWTHSHKVLCSNPDGGVFTTENQNGSWERWRISLHAETSGVQIQSVEHGRFLAFSGHDLYTKREPIPEDTAWYLEPAHGNQFFVSATCHDKRLSSNKDHPFTHHNREAWEKWRIEPTNETLGQFTIRSVEHSKYLACSEDGTVIVQDSPDPWMITSSPHGGIFIQSVKHGKRLACDDNGGHYTSTEMGGWETWRLEGIMPRTISGNQIWSWVGIGAATITLAVAAPFAAMGAVGAMGFGAEGIAAGSMAAGMMSAEAIAAGGGVAAGGTVAALQSIGMVGLGGAGATAAAGVGAAVGGATSVGITAAVGGLDGQQARIQLKEPETHLPLCSWRMWAGH